MNALALSIDEQGYSYTRVADVLERARVSRNTFYKHFANKQECLIAAIDESAGVTANAVVAAYRGAAGRPPEARIRAGFDALIDRIVAEPHVARLWLVDYHEAGAEAVKHVERLHDGLDRLVAHALEESPDHRGMPPAIVRATTGAMRLMAHVRLRRRRAAEIRSVADELFSWAIAYRPPPARLPVPASGPPIIEMAPASTPKDPDERILLAVTEIVYRKGYRQMTITDIAQVAGISFSTFYSRYGSKEAALLAATERGERMLMETAFPAFAETAEWTLAVARGLSAFFEFFAARPAIARLGGLEPYAVGSAALDRRETTITGFQALMDPGYQEYPLTLPIAAEAIGAGIATLFYDSLNRVGDERLHELAPISIYLALAPFVGPLRASEQACQS